MTYFEGFIVPVPEANKDAYRKHRRRVRADLPGVWRAAPWSRPGTDDVPEGKVTDFRKAVERQGR